jgi:hypothetical protein
VASAIELLELTAPSWVVVQKSTAHAIEIAAAPVRAGGIRSRSYLLLITSLDDASVSVSEAAPGTLLPAWCPERHMNGDRSFCLGLKAGLGLSDEKRAGQWWRKLEVFLDCQEVAHNTGKWPVHAQLSHGDAGEIEVQAEAIASEQALLSEYQEAVRYDTGAIAEAIRLSNTKGEQSSGCVCDGLGKERLEVGRFCKSPDRERCLLHWELKRRSENKSFWFWISDHECCGTMLSCPLRKET